MASIGMRAACVLRYSTLASFNKSLKNGIAGNSHFISQRKMSISHRVLAGLKFTEQHEWVRLDGKIGTVGITAKAAESMGDLVYVEIAEPGREVDQGDECGSVESVKAVSDIYAPVSGKITERNADLSVTPELVNQDPYGEQGWLFKIELSKPSELDALMTEEQYNAFITEE